MSELQRRLLAELLGTAGAHAGVDTYTHPRVCRPFLAGCCPAQLFERTKVLGATACPSIHSEAFRAAYAVDAAHLGPDFSSHARDLERQLSELVARNDRDVARAQQRCDNDDDEEEAVQGSAGAVEGAAPATKHDAAQAEIQQRAATLLLAAAAAGEGGEVARAVQLTDEAEALLLQVRRTTNAGGGKHQPQRQQLRTCDGCGSLLSLQDSDAKLADHFKGRVHVAWVTVREQLEAVRAARRLPIADVTLRDARGRVHSHT